MFLGHVAALTFSGPIEIMGRRLEFDVTRMDIKLGGLRFGFNLPQKCAFPTSVQLHLFVGVSQHYNHNHKAGVACASAPNLPQQ